MTFTTQRDWISLWISN